MRERIEQLKQWWIVDQKQRSFRQLPLDPQCLAVDFAKENLADEERAVRRLEYMLQAERPVVLPTERIVLLRTVPTVPQLFTAEEKQALAQRYYLHEQGKVCNISPDYASLLAIGLPGETQRLSDQLRRQPAGSAAAKTCEAMLRCVQSVCDFTLRYAAAAQDAGNDEAAACLTALCQRAPQSFLEALQLLRVVHFCLWCSDQYHNTLGRFDQYLWPFLQRDMARGMSREDALELVEEFFLNCNKDSDLYPGMQQGDNGQSMVLGGRTAEGEDCYNLLSQLCMEACGELRLIDPKINLRVHKGTPLSVYEEGTRLTRLGLGFPQYSNDEVFVPALLHWGYRPEDAWNYVVAACWEVIIPGKGMDIPNLNGLSFAAVVQESLAALSECESFEAYLDKVRQVLEQKVDEMVASVGEIYMEPAPLLSVMMDGCIEQREDISRGGVYRNDGFHGSGLATAVDSLAAVQKYVYDEQSLGKDELLAMLKDDYAGHEDWLHRLRYEAPKFGNDDDRTNVLATLLLDWYADALEGRTNSRGGIYRAGTGSAMYYLWHGKPLGATPDGRRAGEALPCNYSPSLFAHCNGPISIVKSFAQPHLARVANGGPLTLELHSSLFEHEDSIRKVAAFVQSFFLLGGHQLQLNAVNRDLLLHAKAFPQEHRNLIVRVWGWSGYFVELDEAYQDHILKRAEMLLN